MTSCEFGEVVPVDFPQSGTAARKQRPGIVMLDVGGADLVLVPVTSKARDQGGDIPIANLGGTGLIRASWLRLAKATTLLKSELIRPLGRLSDAERNQIAQAWQTLYGDFVS